MTANFLHGDPHLHRLRGLSLLKGSWDSLDEPHWILWDSNPAGFPDLTLGSIYSGGLPPEAWQGYQPQLPQLILAVTI